MQAMLAVEGPLADTVRATYRAEAARAARQAAASEASNHSGGCLKAFLWGPSVLEGGLLAIASDGGPGRRQAGCTQAGADGRGGDRIPPTAARWQCCFG